jgi:oligopeptide/dipeptide ABC transporter ATP-binding protein
MATTAPLLEQQSSARTNDLLLRVEDLHIHFVSQRGTARVVDGASFSIYRNEIFGIAGESGCGKTTLVEAILQVIRFGNRVASGSVLFYPSKGDPIDLMKLSPQEMRHFRWENISYIPQGSMNSLNPIARIGEQIVDGMTAHGVSEGQAKQKVPQLLERVGLEGKVARLYPHELSGGMKQRTIIAAAIAMDPDLIIADEPTTALDVNVQRVILETLANLRTSLGVAILTVSHDLPVHAQLADRIGIMYAGQIVEIGKVRALMKRPLHPYAEGLIASVPAIGGVRKRLAGIAGTTPSPLNWPPGCRFAPRCPYAMEICQTTPPILAELQQGPRTFHDVDVEVGEDRFSACHLHPESTPGRAR